MNDNRTSDPLTTDERRDVERLRVEVNRIASAYSPQTQYEFNRILNIIDALCARLAPPAPTAPTETTCDVCGGSGELDCRSCRGGWTQNDFGDAIICPECDGTSKRKCQHCKGTGTLDAPPPTTDAAPTRSQLWNDFMAYLPKARRDGYDGTCNCRSCQSVRDDFREWAGDPTIEFPMLKAGDTVRDTRSGLEWTVAGVKPDGRVVIQETGTVLEPEDAELMAQALPTPAPEDRLTAPWPPAGQSGSRLTPRTEPPAPEPTLSNATQNPMLSNAPQGPAESNIPEPKAATPRLTKAQVAALNRLNHGDRFYYEGLFPAVYRQLLDMGLAEESQVGHGKHIRITDAGFAALAAAKGDRS